jgi:hypothetical protein
MVCGNINVSGMKGKFTLEQAIEAQFWSTGIASSTLSLTSALDRSGSSMPCPGYFTTRKETQYTLHRRLVGLRDKCPKSYPH